MSLLFPASRSLSVLPSGCLALDLILGPGGIPRGTITEIYGQEATGKSTLALHMIAAVQEQGGRALYVDMDHDFLPSYALQCGIDLDRAYLAQPSSGEEALEIIRLSLASAHIDLVILDSIPALVPRAEVQNTSFHPASGEIARLLSRRLRDLAARCAQQGAALVCLNQLRTRYQYGPEPWETTVGGMPIKLLSSLRIKLMRHSVLKKKTQIRGIKVKAQVTKDPFFPSYSSVTFIIVYNIGIPWWIELVHVGQKLNIIRRRESRYWYHNTYLGDHQAEVWAYLQNNPELEKEMKHAIRAQIEAKRLSPGSVDRLAPLPAED